MSVLDMAGATRASAGYVTLSALDAFTPFLDTDGYSRCLAQRDTDGAIVVVYVRGAESELVRIFNDRAKLKHEKSEWTAQSEDESLSEDERDAAKLCATECTEQLATLPNVRAQLTIHVARALTHYERATDTDTDTDGAEDGATPSE
jgi:hypothetical protein